MKKLLTLTLALILTASPSFAAWTVTFNTTTHPKQFTWGANKTSIMYVFRLNITSDANASGTQTLSTLIDTAYGTDTGKATKVKDMIQGGLLYGMKYIHTGNVTASTVVLSDENSGQIFSETLATSGANFIRGNIDADTYVPITNLIFTSTTLGDGSVSIYEFWILK